MLDEIFDKVSAARDRFDRALFERIRNGPDDARPHARAWLGVVRVSWLTGVEAYMRSPCGNAVSPQYGSLPVVDRDLPFCLMCHGYTADWIPEESVALVKWDSGGEYEHVGCLRIGDSHVTTERYGGGVIMLLSTEDEAKMWAADKALELLKAHDESVRRFRAQRGY